VSIEENFDPNGVGIKGTLFGLPFTTDNAQVVVIPVPWDVTVSYGAGTSEGPNAILDASSQIDYEVPDLPNAWKLGVAMAEIPDVWYALGKSLRVKAEGYIEWLETGSDPAFKLKMEADLAEINKECHQLMTYVNQETAYWNAQGKTTILLGGDHSTSLGHIEACAAREGSIGILQIDAHCDLREAYEGFTYSHASVMRNVLQNDAITKLVQVGIRDYCPEESDFITASNGRVVTFFDQHLKAGQYQGVHWHQQCEKISPLYRKRFISHLISMG